jgi:hypothetical protein
MIKYDVYEEYLSMIYQMQNKLFVYYVRVFNNYHLLEDVSNTIQNNKQMLHHLENQIQIYHQLMEHIHLLTNVIDLLFLFKKIYLP